MICSASHALCRCAAQCVIQAVSSIQSVYQQRSAKAEDWRNSQLLSLLSDSNKIMMVAHTECVRTSPGCASRFISYEQIDGSSCISDLDSYCQMDTRAVYKYLYTVKQCWRFSAVVASFVARTKLLNVEPG